MQLLLRRLGHQVVAALLGQLARPRVVGDELAIALMDLAGDDDRVDVRDIGREHHRSDRVDDRRGTGSLAIDQPVGAKRAALSTVLTSAWTSDPLLGPCRDPFRNRLGGLDVQEVTDVGDDFQRVRGGEPMSVVDLRGEDAAVVGTVELQQGHRDRLR